MKIKELNYECGHLVNTGNYENTRVLVSARVEVSEGETPEEAFVTLRQWVLERAQRDATKPPEPVKPGASLEEYPGRWTLDHDLLQDPQWVRKGIAEVPIKSGEDGGELVLTSDDARQLVEALQVGFSLPLRGAQLELVQFVPVTAYRQAVYLEVSSRKLGARGAVRLSWENARALRDELTKVLERPAEVYGSADDIPF